MAFVIRLYLSSVGYSSTPITSSASQPMVEMAPKMQENTRLWVALLSTAMKNTLIPDRTMLPAGTDEAYL